MAQRGYGRTPLTLATGFERENGAFPTLKRMIGPMGMVWASHEAESPA